MERPEQMRKVQDEALELFKKKNADYGDAFADYGPIGVLMRMGDKIRRLNSITKNQIIMVDDEKTRDTLLDLHNYAAMAIMLLDEEDKTDNFDFEYLRKSREENELVSKKEILNQSRRVRNYSNPDEVYYAVPTRFIEDDSEETNNG